MATREHMRRTRGCACADCDLKRQRTREWARSEEGRAYHRAYKQTDRYKAQQAAYAASGRGRDLKIAAKKRYHQSEKGRAARQRDDAARRAREADREKLAARKAVHKAKVAGRLAVPEACQGPCARPGLPLEAHHHHGYAREHRLDVVFLCRDCHRAEEASCSS